MLDDVVDQAKGFSILVGNHSGTIDSLVPVRFHGEEFLIDSEIIYIVHRDPILFEDIQNALIGLDKFVYVHG